LLEGLWSASQSHLGQVLNIDLDSLTWDSHGIALRLLARPRAALLDHALTLQNAVDAVDADGDALLAEVVGQAPGTVASLTPQRYDPLHHGLGDTPRVTVRSTGVVFESMKVPTCLLIAAVPLVERLAADPVVRTHLCHRATTLMHLDPS
jgi:hypothetical protein